VHSLGLTLRANVPSEINRRPELPEIDRVGQRPKKPKHPQLALQRSERRRSRREDAQRIGRTGRDLAQHLQAGPIAQLLAGDDQLEFSIIQQGEGVGLRRSSGYD
jgi:hypothetical protein